jgi:hypothetical protein
MFLELLREFGDASRVESMHVATARYLENRGSSITEFLDPVECVFILLNVGFRVT